MFTSTSHESTTFSLRRSQSRKRRSGEVGPVEAGTSERSGLVVLSSHGALSPAPPPSGDTMFGFVAGLYPTDQPTLPEREGEVRDLG